MSLNYRDFVFFKSSKSLLVYTLFFCFGIQIVKSQEVNDSLKKWTLSVKGIGNVNEVIDKSFSALPYSGSYLGGDLSIAYHKKRAFHKLDFNYSEGKLETKFQDKSTQQNFNVNYTNLYQLGMLVPTSVLKFYAGGSLSFLYADRNYPSFINNNDSFETATSLSASIKIHLKPKSKLSGFSLSNYFCIPVISAIQQPAFGSESASGNINNDGSKLKAFFNSQQISSISNFIRIKNLLSLHKNFKPNKQVSLIYSIDYYHIKSQREVIQSRNSLGLSYSYLF